MSWKIYCFTAFFTSKKPAKNKLIFTGNFTSFFTGKKPAKNKLDFLPVKNPFFYR